MKKLSYLIIGLLLSLPIVMYGQSSDQFWKLVGTNLMPIISQWKVVSRGGFSGTTLVVSGLKNCNTIDTNGNGLFSCGTDASGGGVNTGAILNAANDRFVNVSGDTMTGALNVQSTLSGSSLFTLSRYKTCTLKTTATGMTVCGSDNDTTDHGALTGLADDDHTQYHTDARALTWLGTRSTSDLPEGTQLYFTDERVDDRVDALIVDGANISTSYNDGAGTLTINATDTTYTAGEGLSLNGTTFSRLAAMTGTSLTTYGTISGRLVTQNGAGDNYFRGELGVGTTAPATSLHILDASSEAFRIEGSTTAAWMQFNEGATIRGYIGYGNDGAIFTGAGGDSLSIRSQGPLHLGANGNTLIMTMTGSKVGILKTLPSTALDVRGTISGSTLYTSTSLRSSGSLVWEGAASGSTLYVATSINGSGLVDCDLATQTLAWNSTSGRFSCGTDSDTTYTAGEGLQLSGTAFQLLSSFSGSVISASTTLASSGTLVFEGAASGSSLYLGTSLKGAGLTVDCDTAGTSKLLWNMTTGRFSCGTDTDTNTTYTAGQGLTLTSTSFKLTASHTGSVIQASTTLASSGTLIWEGAGSGSSLTLGGGNVTVSRSGALAVNPFGFSVDTIIEGDTDAALFFLDASSNRIGIGKAVPATKLDVLGTISGSLITQNGAGSNYFRGSVGIGETTPASLFTVGNGDLFRVDGTTGFLGIGQAPSTVAPIGITKNYTNPSATSYGVQLISATNEITANNAQVIIGMSSALRLDQNQFNATAATNSLRGFDAATYGALTNGTGTITAITSYYAQGGNLGSGSVTTYTGYQYPAALNNGDGTLTNNQGFHVAAQTAGTNIYGFRGSIASTAGRYNLYMDGTAQNYLSGNLGIGTTAPEAKLEVAGTMSGAALVVDGNATWQKVLTGTATLDYPSTAGTTCSVLTITVQGAAVGDSVVIGIPNASMPASGLTSFYGDPWVSAANTVSLQFCALVLADPASGSFRATVIKY